MIIPVGAWVMKAACKQIMAWRRRGVHVPRVSVNLSALQFQRQDVFAMTCDALAEAGWSPRRWRWRSSRACSSPTGRRRRRRWRGCASMACAWRSTIFGTGYSSLQYLRDLPVDRLKIDRAFVMGLPESTKDAAIVHAITSMGHDLGLDIVAEGVETDEQRVMLRAIGCDHLQGYSIARPLTPIALEAMVRGSGAHFAQAGAR